jgi:hypothetical protein
MNRFTKDRGALERQYKRTTFRFEQGPSVIAADSVVKTVGPTDDFDEKYQGLQVRYNGDKATMLIRGTIDDVKHRS